VASLLPAIIGHRGAAADAPENTVASFREAARQGAAMVEFDIKLTADGRLVVMHDDLLDRTTDGKGAVAETPLEAIQTLDAGAWFAPGFKGSLVPTLEETATVLGELGLAANIEIKPNPGQEAETAVAAAELLARHWPKQLPAPVISSFARESLAAMRDRAPDLPRGLLLWEKPGDWSVAARALACRSVHCAARHLTPDWAAEIKRQGYLLAVYTVNDADLAKRLRRWGADSIITDRPGALRREEDQAAEPGARSGQLESS
jgi:glycerophosphoryl diester phosphodiesterase